MNFIKALLEKFNVVTKIKAWLNRLQTSVIDGINSAATVSPIEVRKPEVNTPVATDPQKPVVEPPKKPAVYVEGTIPTSVNLISALSSTRKDWASVSNALMLREYALKDGKEWDAYLQGDVKWPADKLGPGGPGKQPWE